MSSNNNSITPKVSIWLYCLCIIAGSFLATLCIGMFLTLQETLFSVRGILTPDDWASDLTVEQGDLLIGLLKTGAIMTQDQFIDNLNVIYSNIIQLLITLMGAVGIFGFLYIRKMSNDEFEVMFADKYKDFLRHPDILGQIKKATEANIEGYKDDIAAKAEEVANLKEEFFTYNQITQHSITELEEEIADLQKQIIAISDKLAADDNPDDDGQENAKLS